MGGDLEGQNDRRTTNLSQRQNPSEENLAVFSDRYESHSKRINQQNTTKYFVD